MPLTRARLLIWLCWHVVSGVYVTRSGAASACCSTTVYSLIVYVVNGRTLFFWYRTAGNVVIVDSWAILRGSTLASGVAHADRREYCAPDNTISLLRAYWG